MPEPDTTDVPARRAGLLWGLAGVFVFSLTLPATRVAVPELGEAFVGLGRALVAALLAATLVVARRDPVPERRHWRALAAVVFGVVIGFPLLTSIALKTAPASHGAVVIGLLPLSTALWSLAFKGGRPGRRFWGACLAGVAAVLCFALAQGSGTLARGDAFLLAAAGLAGLGYAAGGQLAREIAAWRVLCWALLIASPFVAISLFVAGAAWPAEASMWAWIGFAWVSAGSMFGGFLLWYRGLALGGVARVGQVQLLQPVMTVVWSALLLGEPIGAATGLASVAVVASAAIAVRSAPGAGAGSTKASR